MRIEYRANGQQREVRDSVGEALIARNLARPVYQTRQVVADASEVEQIRYSDDEVCQPFKVEPAEDISPRTGKPKRKYKRRDMTAEG